MRLQLPGRGALRRAMTLIVVALLASPHYAAGAAQIDVPALLRTLEARRVEHGVAGVGVTLVSRERVLWTGGLGVTDWNRPMPVTADTLFGEMLQTVWDDAVRQTVCWLAQLQAQGNLPAGPLEEMGRRYKRLAADHGMGCVAVRARPLIRPVVFAGSRTAGR